MSEDLHREMSMTTLAELRRANLQEQKDNTPSRNGVRPPLPDRRQPVREEFYPLEQDAAETIFAEVIAAELVITEAPTAVVTLSPAPEPAVHEAPASPMYEDAPALLAAPSLPVVAEDAFLKRVRASVNHKTIYPAGTKATVDMAPALFHRAKRYCLDHGNVTLRQVFLDLMTAYLEEEGY